MMCSGPLDCVHNVGASVSRGLLGPQKQDSQMCILVSPEGWFHYLMHYFVCVSDI